jgi:hypothetical protein
VWLRCYATENMLRELASTSSDTAFASGRRAT